MKSETSSTVPASSEGSAPDSGASQVPRSAEAPPTLATLDFALLRGALEEIPFGVATTRGDSILYANEALARIFGVPQGVLENKQVAQLFTESTVLGLAGGALGVNDAVSVIDFDRGRLRAPGVWTTRNLARLQRSLTKIAAGLPPVNVRAPPASASSMCRCTLSRCALVAIAPTSNAYWRSSRPCRSLRTFSVSLVTNAS